MLWGQDTCCWAEKLPLVRAMQATAQPQRAKKAYLGLRGTRREEPRHDHGEENACGGEQGRQVAQGACSAVTFSVLPTGKRHTSGHAPPVGPPVARTPHARRCAYPARRSSAGSL